MQHGIMRIRTAGVGGRLSVFLAPSSVCDMQNVPGPLAELLRHDPRYKLDAYIFVFRAIDYARQLGFGKAAPSEPLSEEDEGEEEEPQRHVTGQELCLAARDYAFEQYGYLAQAVLNSWGIRSTGDIGEIVYNLIRVGMMRKTREDRREDFDDVYDFDAAFGRGFRISVSGTKDAEE